MLVAERYNYIVQLVNSRGSIRVSELSELCQVTEETIRRDLDRLEEAGQLKRSHGGAISISDSQQQETHYEEREILNIEQKKKIAQHAISYIQPYERILLDASSTAWYVAQRLPDIPLTVLTNSIKVAMELAHKDKIEVISTGGIVSARSLSFVGPLAERSLDAYHVNKAFISCKGVHADKGISESNELQGRVKQKMIECTDEVYVLADSSKFGVKAFTQVCSLAHVKTVITNQELDEEQKILFAQKAIDLQCV